MLGAPRGSITIFGAFALVVLAVVGAAVVGAGQVGLHIATRGGTWAEAVRAITADPLLLSLAQLTGMLVATGAGTLAVFGDDVRFRNALDVRPVPAVVAMLAITAGVALQFPLAEIANLVSAVDPSFEMDPVQQEALRQWIHIDNWAEAIFVPLGVVVIPAVSEELLFRGLMLPGLERRYGPAVALAFSSMLFGLIHWAPAAIAYATVAGFALGWLRQKTGSVLPSVAMHGAFNAVPVLLPAEIVRIEGFNTVSEHVYHQPLSLVLVAAVIAGTCLFVIVRMVGEPDE